MSSLYWVILIIEHGMEAGHRMSPLSFFHEICMYRSDLNYINSREEKKFWARMSKGEEARASGAQRRQVGRGGPGPLELTSPSLLERTPQKACLPSARCLRELPHFPDFLQTALLFRFSSTQYTATQLHELSVMLALFPT